MKQRTHRRTKRLQQVIGKCNRLIRTIRTLYWRRKTHRALREGRRLLFLIHQDCLSLGVLECVYPEIELWLMLGCRVRVAIVQEKTTDDKAGLLLMCDGGKLVFRKAILMRRVDFDSISFEISVVPFLPHKSS